MNVSVRLPVGAELKACRMLLPEIAGDPSWSDLRIAIVGSPAQVVGAVATMPVIDRDGTVATRLALRIARPFRRRGLGRAIVEAIAAEARDARRRLTAQVDSHPSLGTSPEATPFLAACGFRLDERLLAHRADYATARDRIVALYRRLQSRGAIPPSARVVPLGEVAIDRLVELHVALIGGTFAGVAALLRARTAAGVDDDSVVLTVDGRPEGLFLTNYRERTVIVTTQLISREFQSSVGTSGWPTLMMMAEAFSRERRLDGLPESARPLDLRFACRESNLQTIGLARRLDATIERTAEIHGRDVAPA